MTFAYVKDEGVNLNTMIATLKSIVSCEIFGAMKSFKGTCFGHAFFKACQYEIVEEKVSKGLKYVSIKFAQVDLQKCITQPKNSRKGKHEWGGACISVDLKPRKLKIITKIR
jgi:hypothetical protein